MAAKKRGPGRPPGSKSKKSKASEKVEGVVGGRPEAPMAMYPAVDIRDLGGDLQSILQVVKESGATHFNYGPLTIGFPIPMPQLPFGPPNTQAQGTELAFDYARKLEAANADLQAQLQEIRQAHTQEPTQPGEAQTAEQLEQAKTETEAAEAEKERYALYGSSGIAPGPRSHA